MAEWGSIKYEEDRPENRALRDTVWRTKRRRRLARAEN
jgi:hypothetical protein